MSKSSRGAYKLSIEYSKSSRSSCKECASKIAKDTVRVVEAQVVRYGRRIITQKSNYHPACFVHQPSRAKLLASTRELDGWASLSREDRKLVKLELFPSSTVKNVGRGGGGTAKIVGREGSEKEMEARVVKPEAIKDAAQVLKASGVPDRLVGQLMEFQKEGVAFALSVAKGRVMIADEMGLGKTVQAIAFARAYRDAWPVLIIVPSSVKLNWADELEKWLLLQPGTINIVNSRSDPGPLDSSLVTIVSYGMFTSKSATAELLKKQKFKVVVLDESHYIKSQTALRTKMISPIIKSSTYCALLSGTPALAKPVELFPQVCNLRPELFSNWRAFTQRYCAPKLMPWGMDYNGSSNLDELHGELRKFMVRRLKQKVLSQLPRKRRQRISLSIGKTKEMKELQKLFEDLNSLRLDSLLENFEANNGVVDPKDMDAATYQRFQQRNILSSIFTATGNAKKKAVCEYITDLAQATEKFIVFAHHHAMLDAIEEELVRRKISYMRIDGTTSSRDRHDFVGKFQREDDSCRVALLGVTSAGQGITLTAAHTIVFAELHWTPGVLAQAEDRAHRIGQKNAVNVIYLVADDTIDEIIWPMIVRKIRTVTTALDGEAKTLKADYSERQNVDKEASAATQVDVVDVEANKPYPKGDLRAWMSSQTDVKVESTNTGSSSSKSANAPIKCMSCAADYDAGGERAMVSCSTCERHVHLDCANLSLCEAHDSCLYDNKRDTHLTAFNCNTCIKTLNGGTRVTAASVVDLSQEDHIDLEDSASTSSSLMEKVDQPLEPSPDEIEDFDDNEGPASESIPKKLSLVFKVSAHSGRIFLYDSKKCFLETTCTSSDVLSNDFGFLPDDLKESKAAISEVKAFVESWRQLKASERRLLASEFLQPPLQSHVRRLRLKRGATDSTPSFERYLPKLRGIGSSSSQSRRTKCTLSSAKGPSQQKELLRRIICSNCETPLREELVAFGVKYCSLACSQSHTAKLNSSSIRRQIFELEHGVCQLCDFDCYDLFKKLKAVTPPERLQLMYKSAFKATDALLQDPKQGLLWQADHINPVSEGGGQCSMFNIRTLCTPCHLKETAKLNERLRKAKASKSTHDIRKFFNPKGNRKDPVVLISSDEDKDEDTNSSRKMTKKPKKRRRIAKLPVEEVG